MTSLNHSIISFACLMYFITKEKKFLGPGSNPGSHITFSCIISSVSVNLSSVLVFLSWFWYFWRITEHFFFTEYPSVWICLISCQMAGYIFLAGIPQKWYIFLMISICPITRDANFGHLFKVLSARFLHCKITIFPFVTGKYFGGGYIATM